MTLEDIQKQVDEWTGQFDPQYWPALEMLARLTEETGEVARELNHMHGTKKKKDNEDTRELGQELSDVIFTVCCIAHSHGINLEEEWNRIMQEKHYGRDNTRYNKKE